jgi:hypothetical protein
MMSLTQEQILHTHIDFFFKRKQATRIIAKVMYSLQTLITCVFGSFIIFVSIAE